MTPNEWYELIRQRTKLEEVKAERSESTEHVWFSPAEQENMIPSKAYEVTAREKWEVEGNVHVHVIEMIENVLMEIGKTMRAGEVGKGVD